MQSIKIVILGTMLSLGASFIYAGPISNPVYPSLSPLTRDAGDQIKFGSLLTKTLAIGNYALNQSPQFKIDSTGSVGIHIANLPTASLEIGGTIQSDSLIHDPEIDLWELCISDDGILKLCDRPVIDSIFEDHYDGYDKDDGAYKAGGPWIVRRITVYGTGFDSTSKIKYDNYFICSENCFNPSNPGVMKTGHLPPPDVPPNFGGNDKYYGDSNYESFNDCCPPSEDGTYIHHITVVNSGSAGVLTSNKAEYKVTIKNTPPPPPPTPHGSATYTTKFVRAYPNDYWEQQLTDGSCTGCTKTIFKVPAGVSSVTVQLWGAGGTGGSGRGGDYNASGGGGGGGGGGAYRKQTLSVTPGQEYTISVGLNSGRADSTGYGKPGGGSFISFKNEAGQEQISASVNGGGGGNPAPAIEGCCSGGGGGSGGAGGYPGETAGGTTGNAGGGGSNGDCCVGADYGGNGGGGGPGILGTDGVHSYGQGGGGSKGGRDSTDGIYYSAEAGYNGLDGAVIISW